MGKRNIDITGTKYGRLIPVKKIRKDKKNQWIWSFLCDCGNFTESTPYEVRKGVKKSCGCLHSEIVTKFNISTKTTHGFSDGKVNRFYRIFNNIKQRCSNSNHEGFKYYGGRGIQCEWTSFEKFRDDMYNDYLIHVEKFGEKNTTIDRIDNNDNYKKNNCRWASWNEQANNRKKRIY